VNLDKRSHAIQKHSCFQYYFLSIDCFIYFVCNTVMLIIANIMIVIA